MRRARLAILAGCLSSFAALATSCKEPTQVVVEARTNVQFKPGIVTAFTVGAPGQTEKSEPTTETGEPWDGSLIGTLVVVPGTAEDASLSVKLVMGVVRAARECVAPEYKGCIVARRRLRYVPNERLRLPITLYAACQDVPCDEASTCSVLGQCVPVEAPCSDGTCALPGEITEDGGVILPPADATIADGADASVTEDGALSDVAMSDVSTTDADAGVDASKPDAGTPGTVKCLQPGGATTCAQPNRCCAAPGAGTMSACLTEMQACPTTHALVSCDGPEDCGGEYCCLSASPGAVTACSVVPCSGDSKEVCESTGTCKTGAPCLTGQHGYRLCQ